VDAGEGARESTAVLGTTTSRGDLVRRVFDLTGAGLVLMVTLPLLLLGTFAVLFYTGRPVFFGHERLGRGGKTFRCWKLRTMSVDAQERLERDAALRLRHRSGGYKLPTESDPRVTIVGRWLRRTHLDELPQLFNVLRGDMSVIGPRPIVAEELALYGERANDLLMVKPGIVGAWTCLGRERPPYPERARLELEYARHRTIAWDVRILLRAIPAVLRGQPDRDGVEEGKG
jgi:lipopolysaccharide/colanic/teichoic acid biosynthesis glycosyltransferase